MRRPDTAEKRLIPWKINAENFSFLEVRNKLDSPYSDAIYTNRTNGTGGVLIHIGSYKNEDKNPEALRLFPSEVAGGHGYQEQQEIRRIRRTYI